MAHHKLIKLSLFFSTLFTGFYAGTGFFVAMGGNPAIELMNDSTFAEYWQHTDHFMAERMKIFGPLLLLTILTGIIIHVKEYRAPSFWFLLLAFGILLADLAFSFSVNHPLNLLVQSWDLNNLPPDVQEIKLQIVKAFNVRTIFMISSFVMVLLSAWFHKAVQPEQHFLY